MAFSLLFILILLFGLIGAYRMGRPTPIGKPKAGKFSFQLNKSTHFKMLIAFMTLLVLLTIVAEFTAIRKPLVVPPPQADPNFEEEIWEIENQIMNQEQVNDSFLLEKRLHPAGDALVIQQSEDPFDHPHIYIERKNKDDQMIEEFLYKPAIFIDNYDFSDRVKVATPVWDGNIVSFPQVKSKVNFITFEEARTLEQLTTSSSQQVISDGYSSTSRPLIIHLILPEGLEIIADDEDYLSFIDEYE